VETRTLDRHHPEYPQGLLELDDPPVLRVQGPLPLGPRVALVGTREASEAAMAFTAALAEELSEAGVAVWSGGARGIDTAAHEGGNRGRAGTVVMLPSGLEHPYPKTNVPLYQAIVACGGTLVSAFSEAHVVRGNFLRRNAVLAACVPLLVVVQCPFDSGARNAAGAARALSRLVAVVPNSPWEQHGEGWREELRLGASLVHGARDVLELLGVPAPGKQAGLFAPDPFASLPAAERRVACAIRDGARHLDAVCDALAEPAADVTRALLALVLRGTVIEGHSGLVLASGLGSRHPGLPP
jgi:DNA processing protein